MAFYDNEKINKKLLIFIAARVIERAILDAIPSYHSDKLSEKQKREAINFLNTLDDSIYWDILNLDGWKWGKIKTLAGLV